MSRQDVISGHYHKRQNIGIVYYVGSPYQIDAGEANQEKGYMIFNKGHRPIYKTMNWGIKYHTLGVVPEKSSIQGVSKGDVVKLKAPEGVDLERFRKSLNIPEGVNCIIEPSISDNNRLNITSNDAMDYVKSYINNFSGKLNKELLLQVFNDLVNE
jgi:DNA repair exonuclease SbcCD nuclease subunit